MRGVGPESGEADASTGGTWGLSDQQPDRREHGNSVEPMVATACADTGAGHHACGVRRCDPLDDLYVVHDVQRPLPEYGIDFTDWARQYERLFKDKGWTIALRNMLILGIGSFLAIIFGFVLAAMIEREKRGEGFFRTIFLYPLAVSLIVTGVAWRWMFNPSFGVQGTLHSIGLTFINFDWLSKSETAMYGLILATVWQGAGFYMALMLSGLKSINTEIWSAARLDGVSFWRLYAEIIIPMMRVHLSHLCDPALARRGQGL